MLSWAAALWLHADESMRRGELGRARESVSGWKRETFMCGRYEIADGARILVRFDVANTTPTILGNLDVQPTQRAE